MDRDHFWRLIEESRSGCINPNSPNEHGEKLQEMLTLLEPAAILDFFVMFQGCLLRAYKWNLWAIPFIAYEGCSDDSFEEFRAWLISRGENFFEEALKEPTSVALLVKQFLPDWTPIESEEFLLAASSAYKKVVGRSPHRDVPKDVYLYTGRKPEGDDWEQSRVCSKFPEVCTLFGRTNFDFSHFG